MAAAVRAVVQNGRSGDQIVVLQIIILGEAIDRRLRAAAEQRDRRHRLQARAHHADIAVLVDAGAPVGLRADRDPGRGGQRDGARLYRRYRAQLDVERSACLAEHDRSEEHTSELQSLMSISYAVFCFKKKTIEKKIRINSKKSSTNHLIITKI